MKEYYRWDRKHLRRPQWEENIAALKAAGKQETEDWKSEPKRAEIHPLVLDQETVEILMEDKIATGG